MTEDKDMASVREALAAELVRCVEIQTELRQMRIRMESPHPECEVLFDRIQGMGKRRVGGWMLAVAVVSALALGGWAFAALDSPAAVVAVAGR